MLFLGSMLPQYILYFRSILKQSCVVWHSFLTEENVLDLERVQKAAIKLILCGKYEDELLRANLESLKERRETLCKTFTIKCMKSKNPRINNIFSKKKTKHGMDLRKYEKICKNKQTLKLINTVYAKNPQLKKSRN